MLIHSPYAAEAARVEEITRRVIDDLRGASDEIDTVEPRKRFCIGVLTPPHLDDDASGKTRRRRRNPEAVGFSARVRPDAGLVTGTVDIGLKLWYRTVPTYDQQRAAVGNSTQPKHQLEPHYASHNVRLERLPFSIVLAGGGGRHEGDTIAANRIIDDALTAAINDILNGKDGRRLYPGSAKREVTKDDLATPAAYHHALDGSADLPSWHGHLNVWAVESSDGWRVSLTFSNGTRGGKMHQAEFFDAELTVQLGAGEFAPREFHADVAESRYRTLSWGRGINAVLEVEEGRKIAHATTVPRSRPMRLQHRELGDATSPVALSGHAALDGVEALVAHLHAYRDDWKSVVSTMPQGLKRVGAEHDIERFEDEIAQVELGLLALRTDARLLKAFRYMNESVAAHMKAWRPFQIAFIVATLPSLLARERREEPWLTELARVDVLWFPTGGGKSEATFGIIVAAMFYDRMRGKQFGLSAWMRYPLRMLSIQQLQRLVEFVVTAEEIREKRGLPGDCFAVGYYVGEANTPNRLTDSRMTHPIADFKRKIDRSNGDGSFLRVLQRCPYRDCTNPKAINVRVDPKLEVVRIEHRCDCCGRIAPIYISDSEIYRYLPSVLVGTVDRLARAGQTDEFGHIYGQVDSECPQHGYARHKNCVEAGCNLTKRHFKPIAAPYDPAPALLIQDELHLLKEALGTYDAHYEGFLDEFARRIGTGLPPKRLAATATIEGFERHVRELYGHERKARRFPARGPSEFETAYVERDPEDRKARTFVGILPNGLTSDQVAARIARAVHVVALEHAEVDAGAALDAQYDVTLLYANTKDSLGNMGADLSPHLPGTRTITGERSLEEVRQVIDILAADEQRPIGQRMPAMISTSIISHGVDVARLNVMAFSGFPGKAADFIQSSSRVGRVHMGLVFLVFDPTRNIDRSTYTHFPEYLERLYGLVQPVPVIRFSQSAVKRTHNGVFAATLINTMNAVKDADYGPGKSAAQRLVADEPTEAEMLEAVAAAYGIDQLAPDLAAKYMDLLRRLGAIARAQIISNNDDWSTAQRLRPKPVASLREVQEQVPFDVSSRRHREVQLLKKARS